MARTRSIKIKESVEELEQMRQIYRDKPEARRLLFLAFLKEDGKRTISEAARKVGISERRGRYWWDAYRVRGLQGILERRMWKLGENLPTEDSAFSSEVSSSEDQELKSSKLLSFMNASAMNSFTYNEREWVLKCREHLLNFFPDIDYIVFNLRNGVNLFEIQEQKRNILRQHVLPGGRIPTDSFASASRESKFSYLYQSVIEEGKIQGFPFNLYHFPPHGIDLFLDPGKRQSEDESDYIGSLLFFRKIHEAPISNMTVDLIERIRPFFVFIIANHIAMMNLRKPSSDLVDIAMNRIALKAGLTRKEARVLHLGMTGHSYQEIADLLHLSLSTVQTHLRSIFKKTEVNKLSEIFGKYFTFREVFRQEESNP